jgi:hypothetical protein
MCGALNGATAERGSGPRSAHLHYAPNAVRFQYFFFVVNVLKVHALFASNIASTVAPGRNFFFFFLTFSPSKISGTEF